jgi:hypothetical protein
MNYNTALVGKWNLGLESPNIPNDKGFDFFHGFLDDKMDDYYTHLRNNINFMRRNKDIISPDYRAGVRHLVNFNYENTIPEVTTTTAIIPGDKIENLSPEEIAYRKLYSDNPVGSYDKKTTVVDLSTPQGRIQANKIKTVKVAQERKNMDQRNANQTVNVDYTGGHYTNTIGNVKTKPEEQKAYGGYINEIDAPEIGGYFRLKNQMATGGELITKLSSKEETDFQNFYKTLPDNLKQDDNTYDLRGYWDSENRPLSFNYEQPKQEDGFYHAYSRHQKTGKILKSPTHPSFKYAVSDEEKNAGYIPMIGVDGNVYTRDINADSKELKYGGYLNDVIDAPEIGGQFVRKNKMAKGGFISNKRKDGGEDGMPFGLPLRSVNPSTPYAYESPKNSRGEILPDPNRPELLNTGAIIFGGAVRDEIIHNMEDIKRAFFNKEYELFEELVKQHEFIYYRVSYKYSSDNDNKPDYIARNLLKGFGRALDDYRKYLLVCFRCKEYEHKKYEYNSLWIVNTKEDLK